MLPLIQVLVGGHPGLLRVVLDEDADSMIYAVPIAVVVVMAVVIAVLEGTKRRRQKPARRPQASNHRKRIAYRYG